MREQRPFFLGQLTVTQALRINPRLLRDQALHHLLVGHFQREDGNVLFVGQRGILGDGQKEPSFPLARAPRDDEQVGGLESRKHLVEVNETRRHAEDLFGAFRQIVNAVVVIGENFADGLQVVPQPLLADVEDRLLRFAHHLVHARLGVVGQRRDSVGGGDHLAPHRMSLHDLAVGLGVERGRHLVDERGQKRGAADFRQLSRAFKVVRYGEQVNRGASLVQARERLPDPAQAVDVKILRVEKLRHIVVGFGVNQHRPNDGFFGFTAVRDGRGGGCGFFGG